MKYKLETLDLHGITHREAKIMVDLFIRENKGNLPIEIITGNSVDMQAIVKKIVDLYDLGMSPKSYMNLGSYIIS